MSRRTAASEALKAEARRLRAREMSFSEISHALGISRTHARRLVNGMARPPKPPADGGTGHSASRKANADALRLRRAVPADTRDLTSFICGDPLPGRSALDRSAS